MAINRIDSGAPVAFSPRPSVATPPPPSPNPQAVTQAVGQFSSSAMAFDPRTTTRADGSTVSWEPPTYSMPPFKMPQVGTDLASGGFEDPFGGKREKTEEEEKEDAEKGGPSPF